jgi:HK97 family phage prohead protease
VTIQRTPQTPTASTVPEPHGKPGGGLWGIKGLKAPPYIEHVAGELMKSGHGESDAYHMAVGIVENWAAGHDGHGHRVHPDVQAAAAKNVAEWEKLRAQARGTGARRAAVTVTRAEMSTQDINDLPDSDFAFIESGGSKDSSGKTVPRSLRHFPVHDKAHADNAAARIAQGAQFGKEALPKVRAAQKKFGEDGGSDDGSRSAAIDWRGRIYPLEDIHIIRSADGGDGRTVEAYAAVFGQPAEIDDFQGKYIETIDPSAFNRAIEHAHRSRGGFAGSVKVLYNHGMTIAGTPSERFSMPIGTPVDIRAETRGLLTRTRYAETPLADEVLENIRSGAITSQSFTGRIHRSDPQLRRGEKYRGYRDQLPQVRRTELGLREYGPVLWPAYSGAEILGCRMSTPGDYQDPGESLALPPDEGLATGDPLPPDGEHSARYHQHALYALRSQQERERVGLVW